LVVIALRYDVLNDLVELFVEFLGHVGVHLLVDVLGVGGHAAGAVVLLHLLLELLVPALGVAVEGVDERFLTGLASSGEGLLGELFALRLEVVELLFLLLVELLVVVVEALLGVDALAALHGFGHALAGVKDVGRGDGDGLLGALLLLVLDLFVTGCEKLGLVEEELVEVALAFVHCLHHRFEGAALQVLVLLCLQLLLDLLLAVQIEVVLASQELLLAQEFLLLNSNPYRLLQLLDFVLRYQDVLALLRVDLLHQLRTR